MVRVIGVLPFIFMTGCALTEDSVDIDYAVPQNVSVVEGASKAAIKVTTQDLRASRQDRVSVKKNGFGMEMAAIRSKKPVLEVVRSALIEKMAAQGYMVNDSDLDIQVGISKIYADYIVKPFTADAVGEIILNVLVPQTDFAQTYSVQFTDSDNLLMGGDGVKRALEGALMQAVERVSNDAAFH